MNKRQKTRWMKIIVAYCLVNMSFCFIAAYIALWNGIDADTWLTLACGAFFGELLLTVVIKLVSKDDDKAEDKKTDPNKPSAKVNG